MLILCQFDIFQGFMGKVLDLLRTFLLVSFVMLIKILYQMTLGLHVSTVVGFYFLLGRMLFHCYYLFTCLLPSQSRGWSCIFLTGILSSTFSIAFLSCRLENMGRVYVRWYNNVDIHSRTSKVKLPKENKCDTPFHTHYLFRILLLKHIM